MIERKELSLDSKEPLTPSYREEKDTQEHLDMMKKFENLHDRIEKYTDNSEMFEDVSGGLQGGF
jgi:hypothetical protein